MRSWRELSSRPVPARLKTSSNSLTFEAFGVPVRLIVDGGRLLELAYASLPPGWRECPDTRDAERFTVRQIGDDSYELLVGDQPQLHQAALDVTLSFLEAQIRRHIAASSRDWTFLHAGAVAVNGKVLVIPGRSFYGKSTLVKALVEGGATYFSDEYAVFDRDGRVHPYPRTLSLRTPTGRQDRTVAELGGVAGEEAGELAVVALTRFRPGADWQPRRLSASQGLAALLADTFSAHERPAEAMSTFRRAMSGGVSILDSERGEAGPVAVALLEELMLAAGSDRGNA